MQIKKWIKIEEILQGKKTDKEVDIRGWIYRTRSSGNIVFMVIRDVTGIIQATIKKGNLPDSEFQDAGGQGGERRTWTKPSRTSGVHRTIQCSSQVQQLQVLQRIQERQHPHILVEEKPNHSPQSASPQTRRATSTLQASRPPTTSQ